jgi:hypothetical protein
MWWLLGLRFPPLILGPAAAFVEFGPIFQPLFVPMAIAAAARFLLGWIRLTRPHLIRLHWFAGLLVDGLGLVVVLFLARGGEWMVAGERLRTVEGMRVLDTVNFAMGMALLVALVVCALSFSWKYLMGPIWWRSMSSRSS